MWCQREPCTAQPRLGCFGIELSIIAQECRDLGTRALCYHAVIYDLTVTRSRLGGESLLAESIAVYLSCCGTAPQGEWMTEVGCQSVRSTPQIWLIGWLESICSPHVYSQTERETPAHARHPSLASSCQHKAWYPPMSSMPDLLYSTP